MSWIRGCARLEIVGFELHDFVCAPEHVRKGVHVNISDRKRHTNLVDTRKRVENSPRVEGDANGAIRNCIV